MPPTDGPARPQDAMSALEPESSVRVESGSGEVPVTRPDQPPTSRIARLARLGALAPKALPIALEGVRRAMNQQRSEQEERESRERIVKNAKATAKAMLKTLGDMKGLPLKLGQMASYVDGLAPPGYEERFRDALSRLQAKAPPVSREASRKMVQDELGAPPEKIFREWDEDPFAAASIGQVHRAITRGGETVAVKVQYPGIDRAIENDLKSLGMLESMVAPIGRRYQSKEALDEIRAVFMAELDYRREADNTDLFRKIHAEDELIHIPRVFRSLSSRRVLTTELVQGADYATFCATAPQADKNLAGSTIWRFMFRALYRHGALYADPHPGNYRMLGGGAVAFLDFGCFRQLSPGLVSGMKEYVLAAQRGDWDAFYRACAEVLGYDPADPDGWKLYTEYTKLLIHPLVVDAPHRHTRETAKETVAFLVRNGKKIVFRPDDPLPNLPKPIHMPPEHTFVNRLQWGLLSVLAGLEAEANWRRITAPWLEGPLLPVDP